MASAKHYKELYSKELRNMKAFFRNWKKRGLDLELNGFSTSQFKTAAELTKEGQRGYAALYNDLHDYYSHVKAEVKYNLSKHVKPPKPAKNDKVATEEEIAAGAFEDFWNAITEGVDIRLRIGNFTPWYNEHVVEPRENEQRRLITLVQQAYIKLGSEWEGSVEIGEHSVEGYGKILFGRYLLDHGNDAQYKLYNSIEIFLHDSSGEDAAVASDRIIQFINDAADFGQPSTVLSRWADELNKANEVETLDDSEENLTSEPPETKVLTPQDIVEENSYIVDDLARKYSANEDEFKELQGVGEAELIRLSRIYNPERDGDFEEWGAQYIEKDIREHTTTTEQDILVKYMGLTGRQWTPQEIANDYGITIETVNNMIEAALPRISSIIGPFLGLEG